MRAKRQCRRHREKLLLSNALFERKGSFAVGEAGAKLARAFESEAANLSKSRLGINLTQIPQISQIFFRFRFRYRYTYPFNPNNLWLINTDRTDLTEAVRDPSLSFAEGEIAAALSPALCAHRHAGDGAASARDPSLSVKKSEGLPLRSHGFLSPDRAKARPLASRSRSLTFRKEKTHLLRCVFLRGK